MKAWILNISLALTVGVLLCTLRQLVAVDHNDGTSEQRSSSVELTDLFVFREGDQTGNSVDNVNLILIMNTQPGGLPGRPLYFSTQARYQFFISRVLAENKAVRPAGTRNIIFRLQFSEPDPENDNKQNITFTSLLDGATSTIEKTTDSGNIVTTPAPGLNPTNNVIQIRESRLTVFAGAREDPSFFDLVRFFQIRAAIFNNPNNAIASFFNPIASAADHAKTQNVNSIVIRVPIELLAGGVEENTVFDVWATTSIEDPI